MPSIATDRPAAARPFGEHDCVRLAKADRKAGVTREMLGAVVHVYPDGKTYEVEFPDAKPGYEVLTLRSDALIPLEDDDASIACPKTPISGSRRGRFAATC